MTPFVADPDFTLYVGDAFAVLRELTDESVDSCVTSPPYWGLRDYGSDGQLGLEATPAEYAAKLVDVFREVRRILRPAGTLWLNLGDSYSHGGNGSRDPDRWPKQSRNDHRVEHAKAAAGTRPKNLLGIPWRVAFALQDDGWYLRADIIWSKPNPMPESVTDRPTKAHEYVFLLTKSARYFFDQEAVREPAEWARWGDQTYSPEAEAMYGQRMKPRPKADLTPRNDGDRWNEANGRGFIPNNGGRNIRSVWEIATQPYPEAHFATFPEALVERCIRAGTSERGCCPECGTPWEREIERAGQPPEPEHRQPGKRLEPGQAGNVGEGNMGFRASRLSGQEMNRWKAENPDRLIGWTPTCSHDREPIPCTVLDPFMGSGTTALVARQLDRRSVGIELNEDYARLAAARLQQLSLLAEATA